MSTGTATRSVTHTSSFTKVVYVTRKVQADFLAILDTYGYRYFPEGYARDIILDVRTFLDEEVIDTVKFVWTDRGTNQVMEELRYTVITNGIGLADDRPGGITYNPALATANFTVYVTYSGRWWRMSEEDRQAVRGGLRLNWTPGGVLSYSNGSWRSDRTYSSGGYGLSRQRFSRW